MLTEEQKAEFERLTGIVDQLKNMKYTPQNSNAAAPAAEE